MSFRLVPNSVTLDDLERHNSPNRGVISPNSVAFGVDCWVVLSLGTTNDVGTTAAAAAA